MAQSLIDPGLKTEGRQSADKGLRFLRSTQAEDGSWSKSVGVTALALRAFLGNHRRYSEADGPFITRPVQFILSHVQDDGSISEAIENRNFNTAAAVIALKLTGNPAYDDVIERARAFLKTVQFDGDEGYEESHPYYGGIGSGGDERPDLFNQYIVLEAFFASGLDRSDATWPKALIFLSRTQNRSESNDQAWAGNDGGFAFTAGDGPYGGTMSRGGMTSAGIMSLLFAGIGRDDPRVQAAYRWIRANYTLDENPGAGSEEGIYFYYTALAKSMVAMRAVEVVDAQGNGRYWRNELVAKLIGLQNEKGGWVNKQARWGEGLNALATARAVIALNFATRS